jgi:ring-1,2-phenylacetyl-CoA epoxidase subunit PaaE
MTTLLEDCRLGARTRFHPLSVAVVEPASADGSAVAVTFSVPEVLRPVFAFAAGQYVTVRATISGAEVRRSYSLCSTPEELAIHGTLRIGVRAVPGGLFSSYATTALATGDVLDVLAPLGNFTTSLKPTRRRRYAAIVAGSGITPVLCLVASALTTEPNSTFTVIYGNQSTRSMMFTEELADLKNRFPARFHLVPVFSREDRREGLDRGRPDADMLARVFSGVFAPEKIDEWFLCGPTDMVAGAELALARYGVDISLTHKELFYVGPITTPPNPPAAGPTEGGELTVLMENSVSSVHMRHGQNILQAAQIARPDVPYSCTTGVCGTCRAKVVRGAVRMAGNWALSPAELAAGQVLTCQATAVTDDVTIDFDI